MNFSTQGLSRDCLRIIMELAQPLQERSSSLQIFIFFSCVQVDLNNMSWVMKNACDLNICKYSPYMLKMYKLTYSAQVDERKRF